MYCLTVVEQEVRPGVWGRPGGTLLELPRAPLWLPRAPPPLVALAGPQAKLESPYRRAKWVETRRREMAWARCAPFGAPTLPAGLIFTGLCMGGPEQAIQR